MTVAALAALTKRLGADVVAGPGTERYERALVLIDTTDAAARHPVAVVAPRTAAEVATAVATAASEGVRVTVRSGGHSSLCAADDAVMVDLSAHFDRVEPSAGGGAAQVGGGATMGTVLASLDPLGRVIPIGAAPMPGVGLLLQGGIGALGRRFGLALDQIVGVELVLADGRIVQLDDTTTGPDAELWWAVRGAGPNLGIATTVAVRTTPLTSIGVVRYVLDVEALGPVLAWAEAQPRERSVALAMGSDPNGRLRLLVLAFSTGRDADDVAWRAELDALVSATASPVHRVDQQRIRYVDQPPLAIPDAAGNCVDPDQTGVPVAERVVSYASTRLLGAGRDLDRLAAVLIDAMRSAPTPLCRVDLQQIGGAVGDIDRTATAFWNRDAEWNLPISAAWPGGTTDRAACEQWASSLAAAVDFAAVGAYVVDARPDRPDMATQVHQAFGANLGRLAAAKRLADPSGVLGPYYRLDPADPS